MKDMAGDRMQLHSLLQESRHSICKPFLSLHKEHECKYDLDAADGKLLVEDAKLLVENRKIIVRSRYFQHKSIKENDGIKDREKLLVNNYDLTDTCKTVSPQSHLLENDNMKCRIMKRKPTSMYNVQTVGFSFTAYPSYFQLFFFLSYSIIYVFSGYEIQMHADKCIACQ